MSDYGLVPGLANNVPVTGFILSSAFSVAREPVTEWAMTYNRLRTMFVIPSGRLWRLPAALSVHAWSHEVQDGTDDPLTKKQKTPTTKWTGFSVC